MYILYQYLYYTLLSCMSIKLQNSHYNQDRNQTVLPLYCLKRRGGNFIVEAVMGRSDLSMKSSVIPAQLRLIWVTPIWMRTDRELAK